MDKIDLTAAAYAVGSVVITIVLGMKATKIDGWYAKRKTSLTPPNIVFPIAWTLLYALISMSMYLAYTSGAPWIVHTTYLVNLALNCGWSFLFFTLHKAWLSCAEILVIWASIIVMIMEVWPYSELAGKLLIPYFLWVSFAVILNFQAAFKDAEISKAEALKEKYKE